MELSTLTRTLLFDTYGDMLTEKQRLCFDLRYNQDLSLGEIAELEGISRQAVRDNIVRTEALLQDMEQKIGAVARLHPTGSRRAAASGCRQRRPVSGKRRQSRGPANLIRTEGAEGVIAWHLKD